MAKLFPSLLLLWFALALLGCGEGQGIQPKFSNAKMHIAKNGRLIFSAETNLPDGTKVNSWIGIKGKSLYSDAPINPRQWDVVVQDGRFQSWFPTVYEKGLKAGQYVLTFSVLPGQDPVLGLKNKRLSGQGVEVWADGQRVFSEKTPIDLPDLPPHGPLVISSFVLPVDTPPETRELVDSVSLAVADTFPGLVKYSSQMDCIGIARREVHAHNGEWRKVVVLEFVVHNDADLPQGLLPSRGHHIFLEIGEDGKTLAVNKQAAVSLLLDKPFHDAPKFLDIPL